jgi:hypothetical protein
MFMLDKRFSAKLGFVGRLQFISVRCDIHPTLEALMEPGPSRCDLRPAASRARKGDRLIA